jgi:hypothetical protein
MRRGASVSGVWEHERPGTDGEREGQRLAHEETDLGRAYLYSSKAKGIANRIPIAAAR